jgi:hypothetical protein
MRFFTALVAIASTIHHTACDEGRPGPVSSSSDVGLVDAPPDGSRDTTPSSFEDTPTDTSPTDTSSPDPNRPDASPGDTQQPDIALADTTRPDTSPGDTQQFDTASPDTADSTPTDSSPDIGPEPVPEDNGLNAAWIGGACGTPAECDHTGYTTPALCETAAFPNGFCTQACKQSPTSLAWVCPDADTGPTTAFTTTRCISADGDPRCVAECDFAKSSTGCRPGYACVLRSRHGQADTVFPVCLPEPLQRWPGEPEPNFDIGESCDKPSDCASRVCMSLPGGYCTKSLCELSGCPEDSTCFGFGDGASACLRDCTVDGDCRTAEGYACDIDATCWPSDTAPTWDPSVAGADCLAAWGNAGNGLSPCDSTADDYIVIHKSKRNLALCSRGVAVKSFRVGLGFAPTGDKQVEGDGKTPEGVFYVAQLVPNSDFHRAFLLSYPDRGDATRGLNAGLITANQKSQIDTAQASCGTPPQSTALGGWIELHGEGGSSDWTLGCAAIENAEIDELWATIGVRDTIVVLP